MWHGVRAFACDCKIHPNEWFPFHSPSKIYSVLAECIMVRSHTTQKSDFLGLRQRRCGTQVSPNFWNGILISESCSSLCCTGVRRRDEVCGKSRRPLTHQRPSQLFGFLTENEWGTIWCERSRNAPESQTFKSETIRLCKSCKLHCLSPSLSDFFFFLRHKKWVGLIL